MEINKMSTEKENLEKQYIKNKMLEIIENESDTEKHIRKIIKKQKYSYKLFGRWQILTKEVIENEQ